VVDMKLMFCCIVFVRSENVWIDGISIFLVVGNDLNSQPP